MFSRLDTVNSSILETPNAAMMTHVANCFKNCTFKKSIKCQSLLKLCYVTECALFSICHLQALATVFFDPITVMYISLGLLNVFVV